MLIMADLRRILQVTLSLVKEEDRVKNQKKSTNIFNNFLQMVNLFELKRWNINSIFLGHYIEVFARRNNLHDNWVSIGNELWGKCSMSFYEITIFLWSLLVILMYILCLQIHIISYFLLLWNIHIYKNY